MTEILSDIHAEVKQFLDRDRDDIYRAMSRTAIINTDGVDIEIRQSKTISPKEMQIVRAEGPAALATTEWFNDVVWMQNPDDRHLEKNLMLDALYPMEYFDERPTSGSFVGERWLDQYGSISGYGNREGIDTWLFRFVEADGHAVKTLTYPTDPAAVETYNARYRQYLDQLSSANPTVNYYRAYERHASRDADKVPRVLGGLSLGGLGDYKVVHLGDSPVEDKVDSTHIRLDYKQRRRDRAGRHVVITGDDAVTEPYWHGREKPAGKKLLANTLELIRDTNRE